jgi:hypothetical protein
MENMVKCPFCGSGTVTVVKRDDGFHVEHVTAQPCILCGRDGGFQSVAYSSQEKAEQAWNGMGLATRISELMTQNAENEPDDQYGKGYQEGVHDGLLDALWAMNIFPEGEEHFN